MQLYILVASIGALTAFEPLEWDIGLFAAAAIFAAARRAAGLPNRRRLAAALLGTFVFSLLLFPWMYSSVRVYTHASVLPSMLLTVLFYFLNNGKIALFLWGVAFLPKKHFPLFAAGLLLLLDLIYPSVIPWYWGNFILSWEWLRTGVYYFGTPLWGLVWLLAAYYVADWTLDTLRRLRRKEMRPVDVLGEIQSSWEKTVAAVRQSKFMAGLAGIASVLVLIILAAGNLYGSGVEDRGPYLRVAILQTNTGRSFAGQENNSAYFQKALQTFYDMGRRVNQSTRNTLDLLVYPESAVPFKGIQPGPKGQPAGLYSKEWHQAIRNLAGFGHQTVVVNALYKPVNLWAKQLGIGDPNTPVSNKKTPGGRYYNSLYFTGADKDMLRYDKRRLVPFGEYLPGESLWPSLRGAFPETAYYIPAQPDAPFIRLDGKKGTVKKKQKSLPIPYYGGKKDANVLPADWPDFPQTLADDLNSLSPNEPMQTADKNQIGNQETTPQPQPKGYVGITPLICYEDLFPAAARPLPLEASSAGGRAVQGRILLNATNNSWFGTHAAWQHSSLARFRAIEQRTYFIRATLTGTSSVIAPDGSYFTGPMPAGSAQIALARIPVSGREKPVHWQITAIYLPWLMVTIWFTALVYLRRRQQTV